MSQIKAALALARSEQKSVLLLKDGGLAVQAREAGAMVGRRRTDTGELLPIDTPGTGDRFRDC